MLVIDPLTSVVDGKIDTHRDRELRGALEPLARLTDETGGAVVGLAHHGKAATTDPLSLVLGSRACTAVARAVLAAARDPEPDDGSCVLSLEKSNLGRLDVPALRYRVEPVSLPIDDGGSAETARLVFVGETNRTVREILAARSVDEDGQDRQEVADWLVDYLQENGDRVTKGRVRKWVRRGC